jgi:exodeoxyribonuclease VII large subunit
MSESLIATLTVTELNQKVKSLLENNFCLIAVTGEISNLSKPSSGHAYFTLKDAHAQIRCAYFKTYQRQTPIALSDGMQLNVIGKISLFEPRGDYQLIVQRFEEAGTGLLYRQFEALKKKLSLEGLFDPQYKQPLPSFPETIAVITSSKSAALRDILITLYKRYPLCEIILYPCEVQGKTAAGQLTKAIERVCQENQAQVILLARGGGSIEDLYAFNDEALARAMFHATIPIVTGIGHETDFTIADFIADHRAATPTAAAAAITPDQKALNQKLQHIEARLVYQLTQQFNQQHNKLTYLETQLKNRLPRLTQQTQTIDYLEQQLQQTMNWLLHKKTLQLQPLYQTLLSTNLLTKIQILKHHQEKTQIQLTLLMQHMLTQRKQKVALHSQALGALSPLETLNRGYAIVTQGGEILMDSEVVNMDEPIEVRLAKGKFQCLIQ